MGDDSRNLDTLDFMTAPLGNFFVERDQARLSPGDERIVREFHELYYDLWLTRQDVPLDGRRAARSGPAAADTLTVSWFGYEMMKCPLDLWIYQELLVRTRPDFVVETGTWRGGSALYLAMLLDFLGHGQVITVEVDPKPNLPQHPRITYLTGSCLDAAILAQVREAVGGQRAMVILDSHHSADHVYQELVAYWPFVQTGDYLIVEDSNVNGHPVYEEYGPGPTEALERFLAETDEFVVDRGCERFLLTMNPGGYLRRVKPAA